MTFDAQQLRKLLEKAGTPTLYKRTNRHPELDGRHWGWLSEHPPGSHNTTLKTEWTEGERSDYRADLLVRLVNGLPAMLDHIDAQAAEIERLKKALRVAVLALAHATEEHGKVYEPAYDAVQIALYGDPDAT